MRIARTTVTIVTRRLTAYGGHGVPRGDRGAQTCRAAKHITAGELRGDALVQACCAAARSWAYTKRN